MATYHSSNFDPQPAPPANAQPRVEWFQNRWKEGGAAGVRAVAAHAMEKAKEARLAAIKKGKEKVIDIGSSDDDGVNMAVLHDCDIPLYSRPRSGLVIA